MAVTIKDVANQARVSISTVSKVINDSPTIPPATKERIRKIMEELNYYPNRIARSFAQQNSFTIGVLMDFKKSYAFMNPHLYEILGGIEEVANQNGYLLTLTSIRSLINNKNALDRMIMEKRVDGLILHVSVFTRTISQKLDKLQFPYTVIGEPNFDSNACWIDINNKHAGEIATTHLMEEDCKRIAFIGGPANDDISAKRQSGYRNILQAGNIKIDKRYILEGEPATADGYQLMNELLNLPEPPDGVVCSNNFLAFGAIQAIKKRNLRIPQDIKIVSFDNYPLSPYTDPPFSVVDIDVFELGVHAAEALLNKMKNPNLQIQYNIISPTLIIRESSKIDKGSKKKG